MVIRQLPPVDHVRRVLREENGRLFWESRPREQFRGDGSWKSWNSKNAGKEAGTLADGRWIVTLDGIKIRRYTIVWAVHHGAWPSSEIDHKNRDPLDDRIGNLRLATNSQNQANRKSSNPSGFKGVRRHKRSGAWYAEISVNGASVHIGSFGTPEEAHDAYASAASRHHGEFACIETN